VALQKSDALFNGITDVNQPRKGPELFCVAKGTTLSVREGWIGFAALISNENATIAIDGEKAWEPNQVLFWTGIGPRVMSNRLYILMALYNLVQCESRAEEIERDKGTVQGEAGAGERVAT
jgi:hypothetical protein